MRVSLHSYFVGGMATRSAAPSGPRYGWVLRDVPKEFSIPDSLEARAGSKVVMLSDLNSGYYTVHVEETGAVGTIHQKNITFNEPLHSAARNERGEYYRNIEFNFRLFFKYMSRRQKKPTCSEFSRC